MHGVAIIHALLSCTRTGCTIRKRKQKDPLSAIFVLFFVSYRPVPLHICTELLRKDQIVQANIHNSFLECDEVRSSYLAYAQEDKVRVHVG